MHLKQGTLLQGGKYKIGKCLGQGSFGISYYAQDIHSCRSVAIKEFFMKGINSRTVDGIVEGICGENISKYYADKFKKEAQLLQSMQHQNIVSVLDFFFENETYYYVMPYIDGENLNQYIENNSYNELDVLQISLKVAKALKYMHEVARTLHLDLKPGNILRRKVDGEVFLIDFGLSKHFSDCGEPETSTTVGVGTPGYAPLEQANYDRGAGSFKPIIDIYALGATMYKLLTRETPLPASYLISNEDYTIRTLSDITVSKDIISLVSKAMEPNVNIRYQNISEIIKELENSIKNRIGDYSNESIIIAKEALSRGKEGGKGLFAYIGAFICLIVYSKIGLFFFACIDFIVFILLMGELSSIHTVSRNIEILLAGSCLFAHTFILTLSIYNMYKERYLKGLKYIKISILTSILASIAMLLDEYRSNLVYCIDEDTYEVESYTPSYSILLMICFSVFLYYITVISNNYFNKNKIS